MNFFKIYGTFLVLIIDFTLTNVVFIILEQSNKQELKTCDNHFIQAPFLHLSYKRIA